MSTPEQKAAALNIARNRATRIQVKVLLLVMMGMAHGVFVVHASDNYWYLVPVFAIALMEACLLLSIFEDVDRHTRVTSFPSIA